MCGLVHHVWAHFTMAGLASSWLGLPHHKWAAFGGIRHTVDIHAHLERHIAVLLVWRALCSCRILVCKLYSQVITSLQRVAR